MRLVHNLISSQHTSKPQFLQQLNAHRLNLFLAIAVVVPDTQTAQSQSEKNKQNNQHSPVRTCPTTPGKNESAQTVRHGEGFSNGLQHTLLPDARNIAPTDERNHKLSQG
jgi:hypothetical protein